MCIRDRPCYICQGWGPQRRTNGETAARAIMLLPQLVGQVGKPGTNSGMREGNGGFEMCIRDSRRRVGCANMFADPSPQACWRPPRCV